PVADGDAVGPAVLDHVPLRHAAAHAPAEEDADVIAGHLVAADDRALRARAGVQPQAGVVVAVTALDDDVMADLPAEAAAVVVPRGHAPQRHLPAVLQEHAAGVIAVEVLVVLAVAVQRDVLHADVGDLLAAQDREDGGGGRLALQPEVLAQGAVEL